VLAQRAVEARQNAGPWRRYPMHRKNTTKQAPKIRLALKKETLKDLSPKQIVVGGFIMKDTIIIPTSRR
jgi:hypothetical protein